MGVCLRLCGWTLGCGEMQMLNIQGIKLSIEKPRTALLAMLCRKLRVSETLILDWAISKEAIDARRKSSIYRVFNVDITVADEKESFVLGKAAKAGIKAEKVVRSSFVLPSAQREFAHRPVVCGFGPCGIFAALILAEAGLNPIVLERGASMERRVRAVEKFWQTGQLDETANVQYGEGGAGTFSDAKLTTGTRSPLNRYILSEFVKAGAPQDILYKNKPHVGTDKIRSVVVHLRKRIQALGGEVRFDSKMSELVFAGDGVCGVCVNDDYLLQADTVILALGHSARDSVRMLHEKGLAMMQKSFSMGVRIEHLQTEINHTQYGQASSKWGLSPAEYKLSVRTEDGRGVYTFCMCPGGYVVASASKSGELVTNGMSYHNRDSKHANAALLVDVRTSDYDSTHPLAGLTFQEKYERLAFEAGGRNFHAPVESVGDFLERSNHVQKSEETENRVTASYRPGVTWTKLETCLPPFVTKALREALPKLGRKLVGFDGEDAILTAIESRSSSPVRISRNTQGDTLNTLGKPIVGLYTGGEGAGHAGGIMSAAADGIYLAQASLRRRD